MLTSLIFKYFPIEVNCSGKNKNRLILIMLISVHGLICTILVAKALKRNGKYVNIQEVMDQWTLQMGYPVITILGNMTVENRIIITQQHFIYDISAKTKALQLQNNRYDMLIL